MSRMRYKNGFGKFVECSQKNLFRIPVPMPSIQNINIKTIKEIAKRWEYKKKRPPTRKYPLCENRFFFIAIALPRAISNQKVKFTGSAVKIIL